MNSESSLNVISHFHAPCKTMDVDISGMHLTIPVMPANSKIIGRRPLSFNLTSLDHKVVDALIVTNVKVILWMLKLLCLVKRGDRVRAYHIFWVHLTSFFLKTSHDFLKKNVILTTTITYRTGFFLKWSDEQSERHLDHISTVCVVFTATKYSTVYRGNYTYRRRWKSHKEMKGGHIQVDLGPNVKVMSLQPTLLSFSPSYTHVWLWRVSGVFLTLIRCFWWWLVGHYKPELLL